MNKNFRLRQWQEEAIQKCLNWFIEENIDKRFLINAAPGTGKTICACSISKKLFELNKIKRVIVIAPRSEIVNQWSEEFRTITNRTMLKITSEKEDLGLDLCSTWSSVQNSINLYKNICKNHPTLIICDEHHHAAIQAVWGESADKAFEFAKYVIVLTGTPIRSDGNKPIWFSYSLDGKKLEHPSNGSYVLDYGKAVDLKYCRPIFFHRHEGKFSIKLKENDDSIKISGTEKIESTKLDSAIRKSLDFYTLARSPQYCSDGKTPDLNSYQSTMIDWGIEKLNEARYRLPNAGGLVIAPNIVVAEYMAKIIKMKTKNEVVLVHSKKNNSENLINAFRHSNKDWIVSVAMISEGVDIKRLRVLIYLPNSQTELFFRQAMGRVVRSIGAEDDSRAYVIMPTHKIFEEYARRVESEMSSVIKDLDYQKIKKKKCPKCEKECNLSAKICDFCNFEFTQNSSLIKKKNLDFELTLEKALRMGGIARQMDITENEVLDSEKNYSKIRKEILESGDARMIEALKIFPDESLIKLKNLLNKIT